MCALDRLHDRNYRNCTIVGGVLDTMCASCSYFVIFELLFINVMNVYHLFYYFYLKINIVNKYI